MNGTLMNNFSNVYLLNTKNWEEHIHLLENCLYIKLMMKSLMLKQYPKQLNMIIFHIIFQMKP